MTLYSYTMPPDDARYSIAELADLADVTVRTVRYYVGQGILPSTGQAGPGAKYTDDHLARLRLVRRLQREHLPLAEIRRRLDDLGDEEIRSLAAVEPAEPRDSALEYIRSILAPDAPASPSVLGAPTAPAVPEIHASRPLPPPPGGPAEPKASSEPASGPDRSQWERVALTPDIELHLRRPLSRTTNRRVERLIAIARELLEEDQP